jgi:hypothetical protein
MAKRQQDNVQQEGRPWERKKEAFHSTRVHPTRSLGGQYKHTA